MLIKKSETAWLLIIHQSNYTLTYRHTHTPDFFDSRAETLISYYVVPTFGAVELTHILTLNHEIKLG